MAGAQGRGAVTLVLIVAGLVGFWAWRSGELRALRMGDVAAVVAALGALKLGSQGSWALAAAAGAGAAAWYWHRKHGLAVQAGTAVGAEEARRLLDLPPGANADDVRAAHRRLVERVHPDAGGSAELAARVNAARDTLLAELRRAPKHS